MEDKGEDNYRRMKELYDISIAPTEMVIEWLTARTALPRTAWWTRVSNITYLQWI